MTKGAWQCRPFVECQRDLQRVRDEWLLDEPNIDPTRGELRLTAEVTLAELRGHHVPTYAHERAAQILRIMANQ